MILHPGTEPVILTVLKRAGASQAFIDGVKETLLDRMKDQYAALKAWDLMKHQQHKGSEFNFTVKR